MHDMLVHESLFRSNRIERQFYLPVKYALIPSAVLIVWLLTPKELSNVHFRLGITLFALATVALHLAHRHFSRYSSGLLIFSVALEIYYGVLLSCVLQFPLVILSIFSILRLVPLAQVCTSFSVAIAVIITGLYLETFLLDMSLFMVPLYWWQMLSMTVMVSAAILFTQQSERGRYQMHSATAPQTALSGETLQILNEERKRIARDLHDSHNQHMAALIIYLDLLEQSLSTENTAFRMELEHIREIADASQKVLRRLIYDLRSPLNSDMSLSETLHEYVHQTIEIRGIQTQIETVEVANKRYPSHLEGEVFCIVQEALANVVNHANARTVKICLQDCNHTITGFVEDDGKGFQISQALDYNKPRQSFGILGMKERAMSLRGNVWILSQPGHGTRVEFSIPIL